MARAIPIGWPGLIGKCRSILLRNSHWSLTSRFGIMESTLDSCRGNLRSGVPSFLSCPDTKKNRRDAWSQVIVKVAYTAIIYHIIHSWIHLSNGYDFLFWSHDWGNQIQGLRIRDRINYIIFLQGNLMLLFSHKEQIQLEVTNRHFQL